MSSVIGAGCYATLCAALTMLSIYDIRTRRVPNKALAFLLPIFLATPFACTAEPLVLCFLQSLLGAACGFGVLLSAGMFSRSGAGIGGGDIKLAGLIGFAFGPNWVTGILLVAAFLAALAGLLCRLRRKEAAPLHLAFVPFLTAGSLMAVAAKLLL